MRSDITPGATFPDFELPDHESAARRLSEIQGDDPLILTLARGTTARRSTTSTSSSPPTIRRSPSATPRSPRSPPTSTTRSRSSARPSAPDLDNDPMIPHTLVLKPGLIVHRIYNGYWFWGRPSFVDLWHDLRDVHTEIRPDWALATPGLREAWDAGDLASFHGWDKRAAVG